jgi:serine/threonine-protein kinase
LTSPRPPSAFGEPAQLSPGDVIARKYRLIEPLGEGGMAVVWVAQNIALDTKVAVKVLRPHLSSDARLVSRVQKEAKATAAIAHKNIVQVFDYGVTSGGAPYIVMELLHGETLEHRIKERKRIPAAEAARILLRAMKGITVAHDKGIVHRDLKPENIFLAVEDNGTERPKVLDFGVASVMRDTADDRSRSGGMVGTPAYLPPEVIERDDRGDAQGDVWALGVILYEMITGELPFRGATTHALLEAIVRDPPPPMGGPRVRVDPELEAIVRRALAKDPVRRYPGVRELFDALNGWLGKQTMSGALSIPRLSATMALPADPHEDEEGPTVVGPSLDGQVPTSDGYDRSNSSPPPPTATSRPTLRVARPDRSSITYALAGAGIVGLVAGVALLAAPRSRPQVARAPVAESARAPAAAPLPPPAPDDPTLDIVSLPEGSTVHVGGVEVTLPTRVRRGSTVHVVVDAPGFLVWAQDVSAEGAVRLTYSGTPRPAASVPKVWPKSTKPPGDYKDVPYLRRFSRPAGPVWRRFADGE